MDSVRSITRKYKQLLHKVATDDFYKVDLTERVNCYVCTCGYITKTIDIDSGVTPMFLRCRKCNNMSKSTFYTDIAPDKDPELEWYRPTLKEILKMRKKEDIADHALAGGLNYRPIKH